MAIEIIRGNQTQPVAYFSQGCGAVYWPGQNGKGLRADGYETPMNYEYIDFDSFPGYTPLYKGDTIRVTRDIVP